MSSLKLWIASGTAAALAACGPANNNGNGGGTDAGGSGSNMGSSSGHDAPGTATGTPYMLVSDDGIAYSVNVTVGGSQQFAMDVDTGSTTLGVAGAKCTTCGVSPEYTPGASATDQKKTATAEYGLGDWKGEIYSDTIAIGNDTTPVTMKFADITSQSMFFQSGEGQEGIIGMGPADLELADTDSYLVQRGAKSIAFQLCPDQGTMWIDGYDPSKMASAIQKVAFAGQGYWQVQVDSSTIDGKDNSLTGIGVLDTGTSLIITSTAAQTAIVNNIKASSGFSQIFGSQAITLPSDQSGACLDPGSSTSAQIDAALPPLKVTMGSVTVSVPATQSYLLVQEGSYCFDVDADDQLTEGGIGMILGDMFLRGFVTIFDMQNNQAGFAMQAGCNLPAAPAKATGPVHMPHWHRHGHPQ